MTTAGPVDPDEDAGLTRHADPIGDPATADTAAADADTAGDADGDLDGDDPGDLDEIGGGADPVLGLDFGSGFDLRPGSTSVTGSSRAPG